MNDFPIIKIPNELAQIYESIPSLPELPIRPIEPLNPKQIDEPKLIPLTFPKHSEFLRYTTSLIMLAGSGLIFCLIVENQSHSRKETPPIYFIIFGLIFIGSFLSLFFIYKHNSKLLTVNDAINKKIIQDIESNKKQHAQKLEDWRKTTTEATNKYKAELILYQKELLPKYEVEMNKYEFEKIKIQTLANLNFHRKKIFNEYCSKIPQFTKHETANKLSKGVTESILLNRLNKEYQLGKCYVGVTVLSEYSNPYLPDITFVLNTGIKIDIEIDEPYIGANGKPIHYFNNNNDFRRDAFFLSKNWIVIRFAEQQIVEDLENCIKVIHNLNQALNNFEKPITNQIFFGSIKKIKQWTEKEAHEMAFGRYRNRYLNTELVEKISFEYEKTDNQDQTSPIIEKMIEITKQAKFIDVSADDLPF